MLRNVTARLQLRIPFVWAYCLACLFISPTKSTPAVQNQEVWQLELGKPIEREIRSGQAHPYQILLTTGQCLNVVAESDNIPTSLALLDPDGNKIIQRDLVQMQEGAIFFIAAKPGNYGLKISPSKETNIRGHYYIKLEKVGPPTKDDESRIAAQQLVVEAEELQNKGGEENLNKAIEKYEKAVANWRNGKYAQGEAETFENIGEIYFLFGEFQKAIHSLERSSRLYHAISSRSGEARVLAEMGSCYLSLNYFGEAVKRFEEALSLCKAIGDRRTEAFIVSNLAPAYTDWGESQKALEYFKQALPLRRAVGDRRGEGHTLVTLGNFYRGLGDNQKALDSYNQALPILQDEKDLGWEGYAIEDIGQVYDTLGDYRTALEYYTRALSIMSSVGNQAGEAQIYMLIGGVYLKLGEHQKAIDNLSRGLAICQAMNFRLTEIHLLNRIGLAYHMQVRDYQKALSYFNQARGLAQNLGHRSSEGSSLYYLGVLHKDLGEYQKSLDYLNQSLLLKEGISPWDDALTLYEVAQVEFKLGNLTKARVALESGLKIIESLRSKVISQELRASYFAKVQWYYDLYIDVLLQLHKQNSSQELVAAALQASENARARSLLELLAEAHVDIRQGVDPGLLAREQSLQQRLSAKGEVLTRLKSSKGKEEQATAIEKEINNLITELQQVRTAIKQKSPNYSALTQPQPLSLKEIQQQVLGPDTLLLEYSLGEDRSYLWLVTQTSLSTFELPKRAVIEEAAQKVYEILTTRTRCVKGQDQQSMPLAQAVQIEAQYQQAGAALSQMVLGPVANQLGNKQLLIVSEGALQSIPFGALPMPNVAGQAALIAEHEIVNLPSASTLGVLRRELAGRTAAPKTVAVIADPVFDVDALAEYRLAQKGKPAVTANPARTKAKTSTAPVLIATATGRSLRDFGVACAGMGIPPLPFSKQEARAIEALTHAPQRQVWLGLEANRESFLKADLTPYRIVHFATHGLINSEHPDLSGLVLSRVDENGKEQNGILQLHEIYNLKLNADLVVLSACETAQGKEIRGEGRIGMARGFMYAGAARVLASLWKVDDEATSDFMKLFYAKLLREKLRPAAALRAAQNEMRKQKRWQSPYYWGGFVLQGEYQ